MTYYLYTFGLGSGFQFCSCVPDGCQGSQCLLASMQGPLYPGGRGRVLLPGPYALLLPCISFPGEKSHSQSSSCGSASETNVGISQQAPICSSFKLQNTLLAPWVLWYALELFCLFFKLLPLVFFSFSVSLSLFFVCVCLFFLVPPRSLSFDI